VRAPEPIRIRGNRNANTSFCKTTPVLTVGTDRADLIHGAAPGRPAEPGRLPAGGFEMTEIATRIEHDLLGEKAVPAAAYYGVQTARALENFHISGVELRLYPDLIRALAMVKLAAARANADCGVFPREILPAIEEACREIIDGRLHDQFRLDVYQGGAGTSTNMNANEVIANRALELMGRQKGEYQYCSPHDHINASQSTNDAYPTALHVGMALGNVRVVAAVAALAAAFRAKAAEFAGIVKMGRTQLQDAVPMTLGQEFLAFAESLQGEIRALEAAERVLCETNMGATAIGTGLNAPKGYAAICTEHLARITGMPVSLAPDLIEATQDTQAFVLYSSCMKSLAVKLSKVCNDLRLLSSGPRCGLREINLPARQPGSSIMPGKVNPVIPEVVNQVCFRVIGSDLTVTLAAEAGQLQLNVMEPVIAACVFEAQTMFINAADTLRVHCVEGITANADICRHYVNYSVGTVTALNPVIGYDRATELAAEAMRTGRGILELVRERKLLTEDQIAAVLDPLRMTGQGQRV
jgi:aspartate ammonia-lyase